MLAKLLTVALLGNILVPFIQNKWFCKLDLQSDYHIVVLVAICHFQKLDKTVVTVPHVTMASVIWKGLIGLGLACQIRLYTGS